MLPLRFGPSPSARPYPSTVTFAFFRSFRQKFMSTKVQDAWDDIEVCHYLILYLYSDVRPSQMHKMVT
jgi:hypothetical protein